MFFRSIFIQDRLLFATVSRLQDLISKQKYRFYFNNKNNKNKEILKFIPKRANILAKRTSFKCLHSFRIMFALEYLLLSFLYIVLISFFSFFFSLSFNINANHLRYLTFLFLFICIFYIYVFYVYIFLFQNLIDIVCFEFLIKYLFNDLLKINNHQKLILLLLLFYLEKKKKN